MNRKRMKALAAAIDLFDHPYRLDPFKKIHWGVIESWMSDSSVELAYEEQDGVLSWSAAVKRNDGNTRKLQDFSYLPIETIKIGEWECLMFSFADEKGCRRLIRHLRHYVPDGLWFVRINQENPKNESVLADLQARFLSAKVTGVGADLYGLYFAGKRETKEPDPFQKVCFAKMPWTFDPSPIVRELLAADLEFVVSKRGTAYGGPKKTWKRVDIRAAGESRALALRDIPLHPVFQASPALLKVLERCVPLRDVDYTMLTQVEPREGVISRHTDIALDRQKVVKGITFGKTMRLHIVLQSNPGCKFHIWDLHGRKQTVVMKAGEVWYTDVRKPHAVDNGGGTTRIHLVTDCFASSRLIHQLEVVV